MAEYFHKNIKPEYRQYMYPSPNQALQSNIAPILIIAFSKHLTKSGTRKLSKMTGISSGAKSNLSMSSMRKDCSPIRGSITLEIFMNFVGRIFWLGTSKNIRKIWRGRVKIMRPSPILFVHKPTSYPLSM